jgi:hypothetical protein
VAISPTAHADRLAQLEEQLQILLLEIQQLRRQHGLPPTASRPANEITFKPRVAARSSDGKVLAAVVRNGMVCLVEGTSGKTLSTTQLPGEVAVEGLAFTNDDGALTVTTTDGRTTTLAVPTGEILGTTGVEATGAVLAEERPPVQPPAVANPTPTGTAAVSPPAVEATRRNWEAGQFAGTAQTRPTNANALQPGASLDLIRLATECSDALAAVKTAQRQMEIARQNQKDGTGFGPALVIAEVNLETATQKQRLLHMIAEVATQGAQEELTYMQTQFEAGLVPASELAQQKAKVRILELILGSQ